MGKTVGEVFQDSGYGFFVSGACWKKDHYEKWKNLEDTCTDFQHVDRLHYFVRQQLRMHLETQLLDKLDVHLEGKLRKNFIETIEKIRVFRAFKEARPDYEETEVVLLATVVEKLKSLNYECRTIVILGDGIHSIRLAQVFDHSVRISAGVNLQYPKEKCFTIVDFLSSRSARGILPEESIDGLLTNYTKLKASTTDTGFVDDFLAELPIMQASAQAFGSRQFIADLGAFSRDVKKNVFESLIEVTKAHYKSIAKRDPRILERSKEAISMKFERECIRLIKGFNQKYSRFMPGRTVERSKPVLDNLFSQIKKEAESLSKCVSLRSSDPFWS